jgi:hypothetical protein
MSIERPGRREVGQDWVKINFVLTKLVYLSNYSLLTIVYKITNSLFIILITIFFFTFISYNNSVYFISFISILSSDSTVYYTDTYYTCFNTHTLFRCHEFCISYEMRWCIKQNFVSPNHQSEALDKTSASKECNFKTYACYARLKVFTLLL